MERKRLPELSWLNLFFCVLVVLIHTLSEPVTRLVSGSAQYYAVMIPWRLSSFVVQGFIFLSGVKLTLNGKDKLDVPALWCRRFKSIVVPYLIWTLVYICYYLNLGWMPHLTWGDVGLYVLRGNVISPFYFVVTIVQFYLLAPVFHKLAVKVRPAVLIPAAFVLNVVLRHSLEPLLRVTGICENFAYTDRVFVTYVFYFVLGCSVGRYYEKFLAFLKRGAAWLALAFVLLAAGDVVIYDRLLARVSFVFVDTYHMVYCASAILFFASVFTLISQKKDRLPGLFALADRATYPVFLCHCLVIRITDGKMDAAGVTSIGARLVLRFVAAYVISFAACILWQAARRVIDEVAGRKKN